jgi:hypothetical protein
LGLSRILARAALHAPACLPSWRIPARLLLLRLHVLAALHAPAGLRLTVLAPGSIGSLHCGRIPSSLPTLLLLWPSLPVGCSTGSLLLSALLFSATAEEENRPYQDNDRDHQPGYNDNFWVDRKRKGKNYECEHLFHVVHPSEL